jgi:hypothetical protein
MAESTLSISRAEILQAVGAYLFRGDSPNQGERNQFMWSREQLAQVNRIINRGQRQFYSAYPWSFLRLRMTLSIVADTADYTLVDGFGGFFDPYLSFTVDDGRIYQVYETSVAQILAYRQNETRLPTWQEMYFAKEAKSPTGTTGQRFQLLLFPTPKLAGTLTGSYYANPDAITDTLVYPSGGEVHGETILAACLACAELERDGQPGPQKQIYAEALQRSVDHEKRTGPKSFGYNGNRTAPCVYDSRVTALTRNGVPV